VDKLGWYYYTGEKVVPISAGENYVRAVRPYTLVHISPECEGTGNVPWLISKGLLKPTRAPKGEEVPVPPPHVEVEPVVTEFAEAIVEVEPGVVEKKPEPKKKARRRKKTEPKQS